MARSGTTKLNINQQVILPLPELVRAIASHTLKIDDARFSKSLYSEAFSLLISQLSQDIQGSVEKDGKKYFVPTQDLQSKIVGYVRFKAFNEYSFKHRFDNVDFVLHDTVDQDSWYRPFNFKLYRALIPEKDKIWHDQVGWIENKKVHELMNNNSHMCYLYPDISKLDINNVWDHDMIVDLSLNIKTTNSFLWKFGVSIDNPFAQSVRDQGLNLLHRYSQN